MRPGLQEFSKPNLYKSISGAHKRPLVIKSKFLVYFAHYPVSISTIFQYQNKQLAIHNFMMTTVTTMWLNWLPRLQNTFATSVGFGFGWAYVVVEGLGIPTLDMEEQRVGSSLDKRWPEFITVKTIRPRETRTERASKTSIRAWATRPFTSWAYSIEASAKTLRGKEYDHQATWNLCIDLLNWAGLDTCISWNKNQRAGLGFGV